MLTRLYIDNYRCFERFEYRPARRQLILGGNGTGKSSMMSALLLLRRAVVRGDLIDDLIDLEQKTRWLRQSSQVFELDVALGIDTYRYCLTIEGISAGRAVRERVHCNDELLFDFDNGLASVYINGVAVPSPHVDSHRSALSFLYSGNSRLSRFRDWLSGLSCFRINPFAMTADSNRDDRRLADPDPELANFASWFRYLAQDKVRLRSLFDDLRDPLGAFESLSLEPFGERTDVLTAEFRRQAQILKFTFSELSEGQRCLICLYAILHYILDKGHTVVLDEPDNFISLREIQPWLIAAEDIIEEKRGQILAISHHPELINQWAASSGVIFVRDDAGPVRVENFCDDLQTGLAPADLIARGWERD